MTPAARVAAAIEILDLILADSAAEQVLTRWGRTNRYAGSGDRAAVRDHVFDALRHRQSFAVQGGSLTGRGLMIGALVTAKIDPVGIFTEDKYAPEKLSELEQSSVESAVLSPVDLINLPEWVQPLLKSALGDDFDTITTLFQDRAPVFLRVNLRKNSRDIAISALADEDIECEPHTLSETALRVTKNPRRVQNSDSYRSGLVEIQDAASQAVVDFLPLKKDDKVLDFCAGGGGKSLAILGREEVLLTAYDGMSGRMKDIPDRASRADCDIAVATDASALPKQGFDLVLCDVPCSGSGAWRRSPQAKWAFTAERLAELRDVQIEILNQAKGFVAKNGVLAYVTCSMLQEENQGLMGDFLDATPEWELQKERVLSPLEGGDGFYVALLTRQ